MSVPNTPEPGDPQPPTGLSLGAALLVLVGIVLLLPGICAVISAFTMTAILWNDPTSFVLMSLLWAVCIGISYGGIRLIARAARR